MPSAKRKPATRNSKRRRNILPLVAASGAAGAAGLTSSLPGYYRDAKGVLRDARGQVSRFASRVRGNPEDIEILNQMAPLTSMGHIGFTQDGLEEFVRDGFVYHAFSNTPVFEDGYRMGTPVEELAVMAQENPAKFDRCVKAVQKRGGAANAYAVCTAAGTRNLKRRNPDFHPIPTGRPFKILEFIQDREKDETRALVVTEYGTNWYSTWGIRTEAQFLEMLDANLIPKGWEGENPRRRKRNPADAADALYETFHGAPPSETLEIVETEHVHEHLAGLGELVEIVVKLTGGKFKGQKWPMKAPDPETAAPEEIIHLAANESANQLYLVGGDQAVDLEAGGFRESFPIKHDGETFDVTDFRDLMEIGRIVKLMYRTQKAFDQFETVDYFHAAGEDTNQRPLLLYDSVNQKLKIAGGEYGIEARGVIN